MLKAERLFLVSAVILLIGTPVAAQISGAIYTTNQTGSQVNGNIFSSKNHVYLNGGPGPGAPCTASGLPNGPYYFQVTNPSGTALLSTDPITNREVIVSGGVITSTTGTHQTRNGVCGSRIVALVPFADTPNPGGEYKVWLTPVGLYDPLLSGFFGFLAPFSKTDTFKVKTSSGPIPAQSVIRGTKFYDFTENGVRDPTVPEEVPIPGWRIDILRAGVLDGFTFTDDMGRYTFIRNLDNTVYEIREIAPPPGFIPAVGATWLAMTPTQATVIANATSVAGPDFGNLHFQVAPGVGRSKGFWHNEGEPLLAACDPTWRTALNSTATTPICLRTSISTSDPQLSIFLVPDPPATFQLAFSTWADYIVGDPALGHGGFILSTQVAAAILNNSCGFMQGTVYIDRFQNGVLVSFPSMLAGAVALLCDPNAGLTGPNDPFQSLRQAMLNCSNEFEAINNTGDLNSPQVVYQPSQLPATFASPYGDEFE
jgi:hypothetical protein